MPCTTATGASAYRAVDVSRDGCPDVVGVIRPCFALAEMRVPVLAGTQFLSRLINQFKARFCSSGKSEDEV